MEKKCINRIRYPDIFYFREPCVLLWKNTVVPLASIKYEVMINGGLANVNLIQEYRNQTSQDMNVNYQFPINEKVVFSEMEAIFRGNKIKGLIKEKEQAKQEFEHHKRQGHTVAYAEQLEDTTDIMRVELGNLPANEVLKICFRYIVRLDVVSDIYWGFRIPSTLTPRYTPSPKYPGSEYCIEEGYYRGDNLQKMRMSNQTNISTTLDTPYTWEIDVKVFSPGGANTIRCPSHQDKVEMINEHGFLNVKFSPQAGLQYPNRDFELIIEDLDLFSHQCVVAATDLPTITGKTPKYAAMMQFAPTMYKWFSDKKKIDLSLDSVESSGIDLYEDEYSMFMMMNTQAEFLFVLDRSGSMSGSRMSKANEALILFLRSLPPSSMFNVISFGSSYDKLYPKSMQLTDQNLQDAIRKITKFEASYGGTEILDPLQECFNLNKLQNYQRNIFLLTDGDVSNVNQIVSLIQSRCVSKAARLFSVGVGSGCSEALVHKTAKAGGGKSIILSDKEDIEGKIIHLLNDSITPSLTNFQIEFDEKYIACISPMPNANSHITRGEPFTMYALLKNDLEEKDDLTTVVKVKYYDSVSKTTEERAFSLSLEGCIDDSSYHKMCVKSLIDAQSLALTSPPLYYLDPQLSSHPSLPLSLSLAYQLLSPSLTAFILLIDSTGSVPYRDAASYTVPTLTAEPEERYDITDLYGSTTLTLKSASIDICTSTLSNHKHKVTSKKKSNATGGIGSAIGSAFGKIGRLFAPGNNRSSPQGDFLSGRLEVAKELCEERCMTALDLENLLGEDEGEMACSMELCTPGNKETIEKSPTGVMPIEEIIAKQATEGFWRLTAADLSKALNISLDSISLVVAPTSELLATLLIIAYLIKYYDIPKYSLIIKKGKMYLMGNWDQWSENIEKAKTLIN